MSLGQTQFLCTVFQVTPEEITLTVNFICHWRPSTNPNVRGRRARGQYKPINSGSICYEDFLKKFQIYQFEPPHGGNNCDNPNSPGLPSMGRAISDTLPGRTRGKNHRNKFKKSSKSRKRSGRQRRDTYRVKVGGNGDNSNNLTSTLGGTTFTGETTSTATQGSLSYTGTGGLRAGGIGNISHSAPGVLRIPKLGETSFKTSEERRRDRVRRLTSSRTNLE